MSAFAVIYDRSGAPVDSSMLHQVMARLMHRGSDGQDVLVNGRVAMGHWHFWTTPEEVGERQPLRVDRLPFTLVFDGRLDNRDELLDRLSVSPEDGLRLSDTALVLRAYAAWGESCVEYFIGEFALVLYDEPRQSLFCARDQLGDRTLFYCWMGTSIVIASEPWAVQGVQAASPELDERAITCYFALRATEDGQTLFKDILELLPAHGMFVDEHGSRLRRYWQPDPNRKIRYKTDEEYADHFRSLLEESVRCRMRANTPAGILMSGGLDSTSVACLAARMLAPRQLTTISFVYNELLGSDERKYIDAIREYWNTRSIQQVCDNHWPFKHQQNWSRNPNQPEFNPYWLLNDFAYQRMHAEGSRVLLTGMFGDHLYGARNNWLLDLIGDGRFLDAVRDIIHCIRYAGLRRNWRAGYMQTVAMKILHTLGIKSLRHEKNTPGWLTPYSSKIMMEANFPPPDGDDNLTGNWTAQRCSSEIFNASLHSIELRNPYRDRRLVEFVLSVPAYQLFRHCFSKYILRMAMKPVMPDLVRLRREYTSFLPLFLRGLEREQDSLRNQLHEVDTKWSRFIRQDWIAMRWNLPLTPDQDGPHALIPWLCLSYKSWYKFLHSQSTSVQCK